MIDIDINQIKHLYYTEEKSAPEIAVVFGCSPSIIVNRMKRNGMKFRSYSEAQKLKWSKMRIELDTAEVVRLYFEEHFNLAEVGKRLGVSSDTVRKRLLTAGYETRKRGESRHLRKPKPVRFTDAEVAEMQRLYCEEELSAGEIARQYNCCDETVRVHLKRNGVRLRTPKEAQALRRKKQAERKKEPVGGNSDSRPLSPSPEQVTPERILHLRREEDLTIDNIALKVSLTNLEVYNILQEVGGL